MKRSFLPLAAVLAALPLALASADDVAPTCGKTAGATAGAPTKDLVDTAVSAGGFSTLVTAVKAADLVEVLKGTGPFTVFAPNDAAFPTGPADAVGGLVAYMGALRWVLTYQVVAGGVAAADVVKLSFAKTVNGQSLRVTSTKDGVFVDGAKVIATDIATTNGVIHVLDAVVMPRKDLVDTAIGAGSFGTLVTAVKAAGLVETLKGEGPFTVFAPTDAAFGALPAGAVDGLLKDVPQLKAVLTYHVIPGRVLSTDLPVGTHEVATVEGRKLTVVKAADGSVTVNGAKVVAADVIAGNGVIHVIDGVALPK